MIPITHPLFIPSLATILCQFSVILVLLFVTHEELHVVISDGNLLDKLTGIAYGVLFVSFIPSFFDFRRSGLLLDYFLFLILALSAVFRELEWCHYLMSDKETALTIHYFRDSVNPLPERIMLGVLISVMIAAFVCLGRRYAIWVIRDFFRFGTIAWSFATFALFVVVGQFIDQLPSCLCKISAAAQPIRLDWATHVKLEVVEECAELFLPIIVVLILLQYHFIIKKKEKSDER
ncbi:MAG: hypothetical protein LBQ66_03405 [Planctomycetaceae bacterium]|nr:hypothetical protein [Planctomycetaceae bacterium]